MKDHFSALELAGLPGMPGTQRGVLVRAEREQWTSRRRKVGKGLEYALTSLPEPAQRELRRRNAITTANEAARAGADVGRRERIASEVEQGIAWRARQAGSNLATLTGAARDRAFGKLDVLIALEQFARAQQVSCARACDEFAAALQAGDLPLTPEARTVTAGGVSGVTLRRWRKTLKTGGSCALAGDYGNREGSAQLDAHEGMHALATALIIEFPHVGAVKIKRAIAARFPKEPQPGLRTIQRWANRWRDENRQVLTAIANPDEWKNKYMVAQGNASEGFVRMNQYWEFDSTPADLQLIDGRYVLCGVIDVWSRRARLLVAKTSSSVAVACLVRRAVLEWGVPEQAKIDNGADYTSKHMERVMGGLGVDVQTSNPFSPWEKPHIERFFRTFSHDLVELLPGYSGHNVADAQALRAQQSFAERLFKRGATVELKMTAADLQTFADKWCDAIYAHNPHSGLNNQTVFERVASWRQPVRRVESPRVLDMLLAEAPDGDGGRTVSKKGLRVDRFWFAAPELGSIVGERVRVLYDPADQGRIIVYRDDQFVCIAENPELLGVSRKEIADEARARQKHEISERRRELRKAARKQNVADITQEILAAREAEVAALAALPAPNVIHITPALDAAREAAAAADAVTTLPPMRPTNQADVDSVFNIARNEQLEDDTAESRFDRALRVLLQHEDDRNDFDRHFLRGYITTSEFSGRWTCFEHFHAGGMGLDPKYDLLLPEGLRHGQYLEAKRKGKQQ